MRTKNIPVFAGQGSLALFTPKAIAVATKDASTPTGALLLSAVHRAFLAELSSIPPTQRSAVGLDLSDFPSPHTLLAPLKKYHTSCIVQGTTLCVFQLLRYLSHVETTPGTEFDNAAAAISEVAGFCSGSLVAAVVASSHTTIDFLCHGVEAFKLAVWIGYETELYRLSQCLEGETEMLSWSLVVFGWTREAALRRIEAFNSTVAAAAPPLHLAAVSAEKVVSVSGRGDVLARFHAQEVAEKLGARFTNVHTLYHGGDALQAVKASVHANAARRNLRFPALAEAKIPFRSTVTGKLLSCATSDGSLLDMVLDMVLIECVNWDKTVEYMLADAIAVATQTQTTVLNFGPGTGSVFQPLKPPHPNITLMDLSHTSDALVDSKPPRPHIEDEIAIVGMGVNMPGAADVAGLWRILEEGLNTVSEIPASRFDVSAYYAPQGAAGATGRPVRSMGTKFGNFLENPAAFDPAFFNISPREARSLDPQQRVLLQTAYTAIENAGYVADSTASFARASFACYVGVATGDYAENLRDDIDVYYSTGNLRAFLSGRISYALKLGGPSLVVDTACSSSLVAIYQACRALAAGDCNAAVAGGVNVITSPDMYLGLDRAHFLSPTGQCKAFDESADGYCRSEGCGMFVLKRLADAIAENDQILGVIRGVHINQSGEAHSITHPHAATQQVLFARLLERTGVDPLDISVIEAHGTGTQAGDPAELASLRATFARDRATEKTLHITSVKANIGHCEAASGAAGLAKLLLMLRHRVIPKQISLQTLNPKIAPLGTDGVEIARANVPWTRREDGKRRLALLNNFGAAGSNGVLLLEEAGEKWPAGGERAAYLFAVTAKTSTALENLRQRYITYLRDNKATLSLKDVCYTATARRQPLNHRIAVTAVSFDGLIEALEKAAPIEVPASGKSKTVFVFSGQGGQYLGMGRSLLQTSPVFRDIVEQADSALVGLGFVGVLSIMAAGADDGTEPDLTPKQRIEAFQCAIFVLEYALARLWMSFGVQPDAVLGHSLGEYAALAIAGVLTFADALKLVAHRARMMADLCAPSESGMLAVNASVERVEEILRSRTDLAGLVVACQNSTGDCVAAGPLQQIDALRAHLKEKALARCVKLDVPYGYHSAAMDPILGPLTALAATVKISVPTIPIGSNVLGRIIGAGDINPEYFAQHARQTVRFVEEVQQIAQLPGFAGSVRYVEIGPQPVSLPMVRTTLGTLAAEFLPSMHRTKDAWTSLSESLTGLFLAGFPAQWREVFAGSHARCTDLPAYPFEGKDFWVSYKEPAAIPAITPPESPRAPDSMPTGYALLAACIQLPGEGVDGIFETPIAQLAVLIDGHRVGGAALCPASVYHELAMSAAAFGVHATAAALNTLSAVKYPHPLVYDPAAPRRTVRVTLRLDSLTGDSSFTIGSYTDNPAASQLHCAGELKQSPRAGIELRFRRRALKLDRLKRAIFATDGFCGPETIHTRMLYEVVFPRVVSYSPLYQTVKSITIDQTGTEGFAVVQMPAGSVGGGGKYVVHPMFMDTLLHAAGFIANSAVTAEDACICNEVGQAKILYDEIDYADTFGVFCSIVYLAAESTYSADAYAVNSAGKIVGAVKGMNFKKVKLAKFRSHLAHTLGRPAAAAAAAGRGSGDISARISPPTHKPAHISAPAAASISGQVARCIADVCGVQIETVKSATEMSALGVDSLMIFEIADRLKATFPHVSIDSSELTACCTVQDLEAIISNRMPLPPPLPPVLDAPVAAADTPPPSPPYAEPTVLDVKGFLETILGVAAHDMHSDTGLDSLGLDSLTSIEVLHALKQSIGIAIAPDAFGLCKTIRDFEVLIATLIPPPSVPPPPPPSSNTAEMQKMLQMTSNPVALHTRAGSDAAPLFLIHDGSGLCTHYMRLAPCGRSAWGIYNPRFFTTQQWAGGLCEMAASYVREIQQTSPGPYILGGWSYGGVVAFEAARQLLSAGIPVHGVVLIDSPPPRNHQGLPPAVIAAVSQHTHAGSATRARVAALVHAQFESNSRNLLAYHPEPGPSPRIVLLRSREPYSTADLGCAPHEWLENRTDVQIATKGWEEITGVSVPVVEIPGNHFEPFESGNIAAVSAAVAEACRMLEM